MTATRTASPAERDLTVHERSLADNCFDEGQYEAAIAALDEIRSRKSKPYDAHIRQLLYIALYPEPSLEDQIEEEAMKLEPGSPSKTLSRRHKSSLAPSPKVTAAAQDLLMKFARTNTPGSLACALPAYPDNADAPAGNGAGLEDSHIAREALRVRNARCCWEIIREGFIQRGNGDVMASPRKTKGRRSTRMQDEDDEVGEWENGAAPAPVSDHAWSVLDWILTLFESDEAATKLHYSRLLLRQIPPSRPETAPRWDMRMPLDVVFHALEQEHEAQRSLGIRLLTLLINLTSTPFVDFPMFLNAVSARVSSLPIDALSYLFAALPLTHTIARFKIMLCRHALGGNQAASSSKPKPQARAHEPSPTSAPPRDGAGSGGGVTGGSSGTSKYPSVSVSDLLALLGRPSKDPASVLQTICFKSELVVNFGLLQLESEDANDRDAGWRDALQDGSLRRTVEDVFEIGRQATPTDTHSKELIRTKRDAILAIMSTW
ncbi:hypothetical protein DICSQDRAFT_166348 [Dichomitus squalens LYAD-421 SS1]|uniref:uncharacterized protein n=1 Tax=Dichomitus squalens (strain LYAD-421) TaxID=732165 RepID=UPI00044109B8|nr:uncharacterized protein DICSQDRAFT_166348 [Dichomitus squalens LYAD-421 SS1]EJF65301.1 hypothetical protein DICSQDRAFT_166348 [Dichomitus squalens LYAD-421 SS1]